jgi:Predicted membrane protein (DUF2142)
MIDDLVLVSVFLVLILGVAATSWAFIRLGSRPGPAILNRPSIIVVAIMLVAGSLSIYRVYSVPILQCPDEDSHIDYAFSLYSAGRLLNARVPPTSGWNVKYVAESWDWERISHLYTLHLSRSLNMRAVRIAEVNKEPADYGSRDFYKTIDRTAPTSPVVTPGLTTQDNPWLMSGYPAGYYILSALEMKAVNFFTDSLTIMFFSVRLMSVAMLMIDILLAYLILRKMHARFPLAITLIFAIFPMTTYVSSCVQPDNLALTLVLLTWYLGLSFDGSGLDRLRLPTLSLTMGVLLFTKLQFYPFAAAPIILQLVLKRLLSINQALFVFLPSLIVLAIQSWIMYGGPLPGYNLATFPTEHSGFVHNLAAAIIEYYFGGYAYVSYWSTSFGWAGIHGPVKVVIQLATAIVLVLCLAYLVRSSLRLLRICRRKPRLAAISALNPLVTGHIWFVLFMIVLFAATDNGFYAQGRHFFPFILSGLYLAIEIAPRIFRQGQAIVSQVTISGLLLFCVFAAFQSELAVTERYYVKPAVIKSSAVPTSSGCIVFDGADCHRRSD